MWRLALRTSLLTLGLATVATAACAQARPFWRVCVTDLVAPPYLYNDPDRPGIAERLLVDAGREAGLEVALLRVPPRRCRTAIEANEAHAVLLSPAVEVQTRYFFPLTRDGALDASRRLASINFMWIKRRDTPFAWDGKQLAGAEPDAVPTVGTRVNVRVAIEQLRALGLNVDDTALSTRQLLLKVAAKRVDLGVAIQEEVDYLMSDPAVESLVMLERPLSRTEMYLAVPKQADAERRQQAEAWWTAIGRLRHRPEYRK